MSEMTKNSDLVELGIDEFANIPVPKEEEVKEEEVKEDINSLSDDQIKAKFEELTGKQPRANAKRETLIATIEELES